MRTRASDNKGSVAGEVNPRPGFARYVVVILGQCCATNSGAKPATKLNHLWIVCRFAVEFVGSFSSVTTGKTRLGWNPSRNNCPVLSCCRFIVALEILTLNIYQKSERFAI